MSGIGRLGAVPRLALLVVVAVVGAACGDDDAADTGAASASTSVPEERGSAEEPAPSLTVGETSLGSVLVDGDGMTVYLFTPDAGGTPTCEDSCAELWPPVLGADPVPGDGLDASLLGTVERADGSSQVTYAGHPLYRYAPDSQPGDVTGQGVNDVWFAVSPDGEAVTDGPADVGGDGY